MSDLRIFATPAVVETYGHATSGMDPRRFTPDREVNTPEEIAAWEHAMACAERGEPWPDPHPPITYTDKQGETHEVWSYSPGRWGWGTITTEVGEE